MRYIYITILIVTNLLINLRIASAQCTGTSITSFTLTGTTNVSCNGGNDGAIQITLVGGQAPFTYSLVAATGGGDIPIASVVNTNSQVVNFTGLFSNAIYSGVYRVDVITSNGGTPLAFCQSRTIGGIQVTQPTVLTASATPQIDCNPANGVGNGEIALTLSGGTGPYTFLWNDGNTNEDRTGLDEGTYSVTITDANNCVFNLNNIIVPEITQADAGTDATTCTDAAALSANAAPAGQTGTWSVVSGSGIFANANNPTTNVSGLSIGSNQFRWTITDDGAVCGAGTSDDVQITRNAVPVTGAIAGSNAVCANTNGVAYNVLATPGSTYAWTITGGTQASGGTTNAITVDWGAAGAGNVQVIETNAGCVGVPVNLGVTISAPTTGAIIGANSVCANTNGVAYSVPNTVGSTYAWIITGGTQASGGTTNAITVDWGAAGAGSVQVTETNMGGCVGTPVNLAVTINAAPITGAITGSNSVCANTNGVAYSVPNTVGSTYTWTITGGTQAGGATTNSITVNWGVAGPGNVQVIETSAGGCVGAAVNRAVTINALPAIFNLSSNGPVCAGQNLIVQLDNSEVGVTYRLRRGATLVGANVAGTGGPLVFAAQTVAGTYTVRAINGSGCIQIMNGSAVINSLPTTFTVTGGGSYCSNAPIAQPIGLTDTQLGVNYTLVRDGVTDVQTVAGTNNAIAFTPQLTSGTYTVRAADAVTGCIRAMSGSAVVTSNTATANAGLDVSICSGGNTILNASGGVTYSWSPGTGLSATNVSNPTASPAATTVYTVTVTDVNGCQDTDDVTVTVNTATANAGLDVSICSGGNTILNASGGVTYSWSPAAGLSATNVSNPTASPAVTTVYTVTVTDVNGCQDTDDVTVTVNTATANAGLDVSICSGGNTVLNASGGVTYSWSPGTGLSTTNVSNPTASPAVTTVYTVTVTDVNGCQDTDDVTVTVNPTPVADAGLDVSICSGGNTVLNASGGVTYSWSPGTGLSATNVSNPTASPAVTTVYTVTVTDVNGCQDTDDVTVTVNPPAVADAGLDVSICSGGNTVLNASGGVNYSWSPGVGLSATNVSNPTASPAVTTVYTVTVTDGNGCQDTDDVTVTVNTATANAGLDVSICSGGNTVLNASGGVTYSWSPAAGLSATNVSNPTASPAVTTVYTVTVTDVNGCQDTDDVTVTVNTATANAGLDVSICSGGNTVLNASGGVTYSWSPGVGLSATNVSNPTASPAVTTVYTVTVTDVNGCQDTDDVTVTIGPAIIADAGSDVSICAGGSTNLNASGGVNYSWSPASGLSATNIANPVASPAITTVYTVTVDDGNGCQDTDNVTVTVNTSPASFIVSGGGSYCTGLPTPSVITLSGSEVGVNYTLVRDGAVDVETIPGTGNILNFTAQTTVGTYTVRATALCQATMTGTALIIENPLPSANADLDVSICLGDNTVLNASGGVNYSWSPATGLSATNVSNPTASPAITTIYTVTVTDANGCTDTDDVTVTVTTPPNAGVPTDAPACSTDSNYNLFNQLAGENAGGVWTKTGGTGNGDVLNGNTGIVDFTAAIVGTFQYTYTVMGTGGCTDATAIVTITLHSISLSSSITNATTCAATDGAINLTITNTAVGPYVISWTGPNGFVSSNEDLTNLAAGIYNVQVLDTNTGCVASASYNVTEPVSFTVDNVSISHVLTCGGTGSIDITVSGASGAETYSWIDLSGLGFAANTPDIAGLAAGTYQLTITDGACQLIQQHTVNPPVTVAANAVVSNASSCGAQDGSIQVNITAGVGDYNIQMTGPGGPYNVNNVVNTHTFTNLGSGNYTIIVTDNTTLCAVNLQREVEEPVNFTVNSTDIDPITVCGGTDGSITITLIGAVAPTFSWIGPNGFVAATQNIVGLEAGAYTLTITDGLCQDVVGPFVVGDPGDCNFTCDQFVVSTLTDAASCQDTQDGDLFFLLENVSNTSQFNVYIRPEGDLVYDVIAMNNVGEGKVVKLNTQLLPGNYEVQVEDPIKICTTAVMIVKIGTKEFPTASLLPVQQPTCAITTGTISVTLNSTSDNFLVRLLDNGNNIISISPATSGNYTVTFSNVTSGTYSVTFENQSGSCSISTLANIIINTIPTVPLNAANPVNSSYCEGNPVSQISVDDPGVGFTVNWYDAATSGNLVGTGFQYTPASLGEYYAEVLNDLTGCVSANRVQATVTEIKPAVVNAGAASTICLAEEIELATANLEGTTLTTWSIASQPVDGNGLFGGGITQTVATNRPDTVTFSATIAGAYTLRLATENGVCAVVQDDVVITVRSANNPLCGGIGGTGTCATVKISEPTITPATCKDADGSITFHIKPFVPAFGNKGVEISIQGADDTNNTIDINIKNDSVFNNLLTGQYNYTITYGDETCIKTGVFNIGNKPVNNVTLAVDPPNKIDATCDGADGSVTFKLQSNLNLATLGYSFGLAGFEQGVPTSELQGGDTFIFDNLAQGNYNLIIDEKLGCEPYIVGTVTVGFPGIVGYSDVVVKDPDCENDGANGSILFNIDNNFDGGKYKVAWLTDFGAIPTDDDFEDGLSPAPSNPVFIPNLSAGQYYVWIRSLESECPTRIAPALTVVRGATKVSFTATTQCLFESIELSQIKGVSNTDFEYVLSTSGAISNTGTIPFSESSFTKSITGLAEGSYELLLRQPGATLSCPSDVLKLNVNGPSTILQILEPVVPHPSQETSFSDDPTAARELRVIGGSPEYAITLLEQIPNTFVYDTVRKTTVIIKTNSDYTQRYFGLGPGTYTANIVDDMGCIAEREFIVPEKTDIFIPNVFTPDKDVLEQNEVFYIRNLPTTTQSKLVITNRWGNEVYSSSNYQNDWNAEGTSDGIYYYRLQAGGQEYAGWVEIIRGKKP